MCRSSAQGGRRCAGRGASTATPTISLIDETQLTREGLHAAATEVRVLEDRDRVDELARQIPAGRKDAFGQTLDDKGRRFFALRESGYIGPIDQDGYPDTTSESADTLRYMATQRGESVDR